VTEEAEAFERFRRVTAEVLRVKPARITPAAHFADDLDADSVDLVELVLALEEEFGVAVDDGAVEGIERVDQAFDLVRTAAGA
jgi:acyl carrier protein